MPDRNDLIIIYAMKTSNEMGLFMSRFNLTQSIKLHATFRDYSMSNYYKPNICPDPQYIQSIFVNSFIEYNAEEKTIIKNNKNNNWYIYQKDIVTVIACKNGNNQVYYENQKIKMLQCLNILDDLNNSTKHIIKLKKGSQTIVLDIYNDPNLKSLRDVSIEFYPIEINENPVILSVKNKNGIVTYVNLRAKTTIYNPAVITFKNNISYNTNKAISLLYRLKKSEGGENESTCHLSSDVCNFELFIENNVEVVCNIPHCLFCDGQSNCVKCNENIYGLYLNTTFNSCFCDEKKGFRLYPLEKNDIKMCICTKGYSFYKDTNLCLPNSILNNGSFYKNRSDDTSSIPIYDDCPNNCKTCKIEGNNTLCCIECMENNINCIKCSQNDSNVIEDTTEPIVPDLPTDDACLAQKLIWFGIGRHIFYYAKINNCIYIYNNGSLFFYSNKTECESNNDYIYISNCLKNDKITNKANYYSFLNENYEYNPNDANINIYKTIDNFTFHLVNSQTNKKYSDLVISEKCQQKLIEKYTINPNYKNLLIFKIDIKRNKTRQVEYQLYNPEPQKIIQKLNLSLCLNGEKDTKSTRRRLDGSVGQNGIELEINQVNISLPIDWNEQQLEYIDELYNKKGIFFFNSTEEFYNDVCNKYETSAKTDMYLQDRREKIYPTDNLCEKNCVLIDFNNDTNKIICKCPIKTSTDDYDKEDSFLSRNIDDAFDEKYLLPNIRVLKCFKIAFKVVHKNFLFYLTFCLLIGFIVAFFLGGGYKPFSDDPFDEFNEIIDELIEKADDDNNDDRSSNNDNNNKSFNNKTNDDKEDLISSQNTEQKDDEKRKNFKQ
jgi:hypothetical protein